MRSLLFVPGDDPRKLAKAMASGADALILDDDAKAECNAIRRYTDRQLDRLIDAGIPTERICLDPGIGFGKTVDHCVELLQRLDEIVAIGQPVLVGLSRKSFLGKLLGDPAATQGPIEASIAGAVAAYQRGATIFRVHDVHETVTALRIASAVAA